MSHLSLDARAILDYLNELGYRNISAEQLKEFLKDLRKLIKHEERLAAYEKREVDTFENLYKRTTAAYRAKIDENLKRKSNSSKGSSPQPPTTTTNTKKNIKKSNEMLYKSSDDDKHNKSDIHHNSILSSTDKVYNTGYREGNVHQVKQKKPEIENVRIKTLSALQKESKYLNPNNDGQKSYRVHEMKGTDETSKMLPIDKKSEKTKRVTIKLQKHAEKVEELKVKSSDSESYPNYNNRFLPSQYNKVNFNVNNKGHDDKVNYPVSKNEYFLKPHVLFPKNLPTNLKRFGSARDSVMLLNTYRMSHLKTLPKSDENIQELKVHKNVQEVKIDKNKENDKVRRKYQIQDTKWESGVNQPKCPTSNTTRYGGQQIPLNTGIGNMVPRVNRATPRARKPSNRDPVELYHYYKREWTYFRHQIPGEMARQPIRWNVRYQMLDPQ